ncbi:MAG: hypothetical protein JJT94_09435 [Bernardetiaceae bacterium]|nr:hypothetical protein [Bernardetiaceae bacterium]
MGTIGYDIEQDEVYLQGKQAAQIRFALTCLAKGFSIEMTAELTGLSEEQVQKLKDEMENQA